MRCEFINTSKFPLPRAMLQRWIKGCIGKLSQKEQRLLTGKELVVVFVPKKEMKRMNHQYRGKNYATDVLSFQGQEAMSLGEIVIAPEVIRVQAKGTGLTYHQELCYMVLHGFLHQLGYDHETSARDAKVMFALQDRVFESLATRFKFR